MVVHGLAATIRSAEDNETFDLAGQTATTISTTIQSAFSEPFVPLSKMIRITFIIGAGKQARQKYDENTMKAVTTELQKCGYVDDRTASCVMECAGTFKMQHDTAKNLKTIVVFPQFASTSATSLLAGSERNADHDKIEMIIPKDSPGYKIAVCSMNVFKNMITSKCPSWIQKRGCLNCIEGIRELIDEFDGKLMTGKTLNDAEQAFYDVVISIDTKEQYVKDEMTKQVDTGNITKYDKEILLEQNSKKMKELQMEKKSTTKAEQRKQAIELIQPVSLPNLRNEVEIRKLQKELIPLIKLYEDNKGKLVSLKDSQKLARKDEIEEEIQQLEESSRGWFEDEDLFLARVQSSRNVLTNALRSSSGKKYAPSSYASAAAAAASASIQNNSNSTQLDNRITGSKNQTKWVLPTEINKKKSTGPVTKNKGKNQASLFTRARMLSSDDEEDDDSVDEKENQVIESRGNTKEDTSKNKAPNQTINSSKSSKSKAVSVKKDGFSNMTLDSDSEDDNIDNTEDKVPENSSPTNENTGTSKTKKKKKKNNNNSNEIMRKTIDREGDRALNAILQQNKKMEAKKVKEQINEKENENPIVSIVKVVSILLYEILLAFVTWLATSIMGKPKKNKNKKS